MNQTHDPDRNARNALRLMGPDPANWVPDRPGVDHNIAIIGGGQTGCALAFALRRTGIGKVTILEAAPNEERAGIWLNAARMNLLRTPKSLVGPELGNPALGFQAWFEARHGEAAYAAIDRIVRTDWAAYLSWYKAFLKIEPRYSVRVEWIEPVSDHFRLHLTTPSGAMMETSRKIILATGFAGAGGPYLPEEIGALPRDLYAHTEEPIDFAALRGKTVGVVGAAAAAFDAAGVALENGAAAVHLFARRDSIAALPVTRARGFPGAYDNYHSLPDADRWTQAIRFFRAGSTPTTDAIERAVAFTNFRLHLNAPLTTVRAAGDGIEAVFGTNTHQLDFLIAGTGYSGDVAARPELRALAPHIQRWCDRYAPPAGEQDDRLGLHPYLGAGHELMEKAPGAAPLLRHIHVQNPSGFVSFGLPIGDVPSMKRDIPTIVARISADLFQADLDLLRPRMLGTVPPDFGPELYQAALAR